MNVLVVAPHPDDESIGCGGSIARHVSMGDRVEVLFLTNGERGMEGWLPDATDAERGRAREAEAYAARAVLGPYGVTFAGIPDGMVATAARHPDSRPYIDAQFVIQSRRWDRVYMPHPADAHVDHKAVIELAGPHLPAEVCWFYECWTPLSRPDPAKLTDITPWLGHKYGAIRCYKSQLHNSFDHAIIALNHYRGLLLGPNKMYAECFG